MPQWAAMEKTRKTSGMMEPDKIVSSACDQHGEDPTMGQVADGPLIFGQAQNDADGGDYSALPDGEEFSKMGISGPGNPWQLHRLTDKLEEVLSPSGVEAHFAEAAGDRQALTPIASAGRKRGITWWSTDQQEEFAALRSQADGPGRRRLRRSRQRRRRLSQAVAAEQYRARLAGMDKFATSSTALSRPRPV